mmetsp:Transcript_45446/g.88782  ORF Transcript_45446/g.88782 Transcript_45446/m.88782 type:complete len:88 (-) Transcript_45446:488-751(-)
MQKSKDRSLAFNMFVSFEDSLQCMYILDRGTVTLLGRYRAYWIRSNLDASFPDCRTNNHMCAPGGKKIDFQNEGVDPHTILYRREDL